MTTLVDTWADFGRALRALRRAPRFTTLAAGTLGLALGALAAIFSVVDAVLLRPLPYANPNELVYIAASAPGSNLPAEFGVSPEFYLQYRDAKLLESVSFYNGGTNTLRVADYAERIPMLRHSPDLFRTLGVTPILGRLPLPEDGANVTIISHRLWTTWFASDPQVIGRSYSAAGETRTVIGVMGPDFAFPNGDIALWIPFGPGLERLLGTGAFGGGLVARMKSGTSQDALVGELNQLALNIPERFGGQPSNAFVIEQHRSVVRSLKEYFVGGGAVVLWFLLGSAGIVLLIACANVANLFMVRAEQSRQKYAVRWALGGTRARLIREGLSESLVVALLAGAFAIALVQVGVPILLRAAPDYQRLDDVGLSTVTLLFTFAGSILAALVCGLAPALRASSPRLTQLREGGRGPTQRRRWGQDGLVVAQTAFALLLLISSTLLVRSFWALQGVDLGYDTEEIITFQFAPDLPGLIDGPSYAQFHLDFMERVAALPGVESVGVVNNVPLDEYVNPGQFVREGDASEPDVGTLLSYTYSGGDYFTTMRIDLQTGRTFTRADHLSEHGNVVISRSAAELLWPSEENPIGRRLRRQDGDDWHTVVGIVEDVQYGFGETSPSLVYFPLSGPTPASWMVATPGYVVKTARAGAIAPEIRDLVRQVAPGAPTYAVYTMAELAAREMVILRFTMFMLGVASMLALFLSAIGLFGVLSYGVAARTREIGVRMAFGAQPQQVQRTVVGKGVGVVACGVAIGLGLALLSTRILDALLFGVEPSDVGTFASMSATMLVVGLLASYLPARRASNVDPIEALGAD
jgi:putative ABC transport system permease protein